MKNNRKVETQMKNRKGSLILAGLLCVGMLLVPVKANAAETKTADDYFISTVTSSADTVTVSVELDKNSKLTSGQTVVYYDKALMEVESVDSADFLGIVDVNTNYVSEEGKTGVSLAWASIDEVKKGGDVLTITFKVINAYDGEYVTVETDTLEAYNENGEELAQSEETQVTEKVIYLNFEERNGKIYYVVDGKIQKSAGLVYLNGYYYYVQWDGSCIQNKFYYKVSNTNGLLDAGYYWFDRSGRLVIEEGKVIKEYNGSLYLLENGIVHKGTGLQLASNGSYYYVPWDGKLVVDTMGYKVAKTNNTGVAAGKYYFDSEGKMNTSTGLVDFKGDTYVLRDGIVSYSTGVEEIGGYYYYVMWNGHVVKNSKKYLIAKTNGSDISLGFHAIDEAGRILQKDGTPYTKAN